MTLKKFLIGFGVVAIILTLIPILSLDYWWIRMFDFPHLQLTVLTLLAILAFFIKFDIRHDKDYIFMSLLIGCFIYQLVRITPYTPFYPKEVYDTSDSSKLLKVFSANVLQDNENSAKLIDQMKQIDADIMIFLETNTRWKNDIVNSLPSVYKYKVEMPLDNTYGILLYSKLELVDPQIKFMVDDSIPSIHTKFKMPSGEMIQLYAIHPTPPMPQENPTSTDRDAEMMMTAQFASKSKLPVIVAGDFNDVAWSSTSLLFQDISMLLDIRVGRGFFCTFDAKKPLLRWPLDHLYVSPEFRLKDTKTGEAIESDHFPFYVELSFEPDLAEEQKADPPTEEQIKDAQDQIDNFRQEQAKKQRKGEE